MDTELTKKEKEVLISLIDSQQFDGAKWEFEGVSLDKLKTKLRRKSGRR